MEQVSLATVVSVSTSSSSLQSHETGVEIQKLSGDHGCTKRAGCNAASKPLLITLYAVSF